MPKLDVELQKCDDGLQDLAVFKVQSVDGSPMTAQQILEAVAEALLLHWDIQIDHKLQDNWDS